MRVASGCLLIIIAIAILVVVMVIPVLPMTAENRDVDNYLQALLCQPTDRIVREQYSFTDRDGTNFSMDVYCETVEGQREDVTGKWVLFSMIGFAVPLLIGIGAFILAGRRRAISSDTFPGVALGTPTSFSTGSTPQVVVTRYGGGSSSPVEGVEFKDGVLKVGGMQISMGGFSPEQIETLKRQAAQAQGQTPSGDTDFVAKLKQIQEARDAGLISSAEYDHLRQEILDNMG
jgi:hypothetical protein